MEKDPQPEDKPEEKVEMKEEGKGEEEDDLVVNPYTIANKTNKEIDYNKLINRFGCYNITPELIERMEKYIGKPVHYFIRRGIFFSHRDLDMIMTACENHKYSSPHSGTTVYRPSTCIQDGARRRKRCTWGTCCHSCSASGCRRPSTSPS